MKLSRRAFLSALPLAAVACRARPLAQKPGLSAGEEWALANSPRPSTDPGQERELLAEAERNIRLGRNVRAQLWLHGPEGEPLPAGTRVAYQLQRHQFDWGLAHTYLDEQNRHIPENQLRSRLLASTFNCTTAKCYWDERWHQPIEHNIGERHPERFIAEASWGHELGMRVKGHPLIWTVPKAIPDWLEAMPLAKQLERLGQHISQMVAAAPEGVVTHWDLANETIWEPLLTHTRQRVWPHLEPMADVAAFLVPYVKLARSLTPGTVLSLNDYGLERTYRPEVTAAVQISRYVELAQRLQDAGAAPDALGTQCHVGEPYTLAELAQSWAALAQAGLPLQVTEFWHKAGEPDRALGSANPSYTAAEEYIEKIYTLAYGTPAMAHFSYWGSARNLFVPGTTEPVPMFKAIRSLLTSRWQSAGTIVVQEGGMAILGGFQGTYSLSMPGSSRPIIVELAGGGQQTQLTLGS